MLEAAWAELVAGGFNAFTFEGVATRAHTSRPVLSRRWQTRQQLAIAAIRHHSELDPVTIPDTGTLRGDLVEFLREVASKRVEYIALFSTLVATSFEENGEPASVLRTQALGPGSTRYDELLRRAADRGDIDPTRLTPRVAQVPVDLIRNDLIMYGRNLDDGRIVAIVDEVFLPLVAPDVTPRLMAPEER